MILLPSPSGRRSLICAMSAPTSMRHTIWSWGIVGAAVFFLKVPSPMPMSGASPTRSLTARKPHSTVLLAPETVSKVAIQVQPTGNLRQRALTLSEEIVTDLHRHGWTVTIPHKPFPPETISPLPTDKKGREQWARSRSEYFRSRFLQRVFDIRKEFSQLHIRDKLLDDFFKSLGIISQEDINRQLGPDQRADVILPVEIEEVAMRLQVLADQTGEGQK